MVTIERETYYTLDEINSLISSGQVAAADQWEVYELSYNSGFSVGWNMCRMFVNKHTGAVTGILGMEGMSGSSNNTILTNSNLGIHEGMRLRWPGLQVYTTTTSAASAAQTVYFASPSFMSLVVDTTPSHRSYVANICLRTNQTSGGNDAKVKAPSYGTTGNISPTVGNNLIWQGWYLADNT